MKYAIYLWLLLSQISYSYAEEGFPTSCQALPVVKETVVLHAKDPTMVFIHNLSNTDLWITHPVSEPNASAGWSSRLEINNWSALMVDQASFELSCIESKPGHEQQIPCAGVLAVCEWGSVKLPPQTKGTFWVGENMSVDALKAYVGRQGFVLPNS